MRLVSPLLTSKSLAYHLYMSFLCIIIYIIIVPLRQLNAYIMLSYVLSTALFALAYVFFR